MAKIIGRSGSLELLQAKFLFSGIEDFTTLDAIKNLQEHPAQIIGTITIEDIKYAREVLEKNEHLYYGVLGECAIIRELNDLSQDYYIINETKLSFSKAVFWKKYQEFVKTCKIDHIVVGPTGIFLLETKNWTRDCYEKTDFSPAKQIERAGYIFYIHIKEFFGALFPVFTIVATYKKHIWDYHEFVYYLEKEQLLPFILSQEGYILSEEVDTIARWLSANPTIYNDAKSKELLSSFESIISKKGFIID